MPDDSAFHLQRQVVYFRVTLADLLMLRTVNTGWTPVEIHSCLPNYSLNAVFLRLLYLES